MDWDTFLWLLEGKRPNRIPLDWESSVRERPDPPTCGIDGHHHMLYGDIIRCKQVQEFDRKITDDMRPVLEPDDAPENRA